MGDNILLSAVYDCTFKALMLDPDMEIVLKELINMITGIPLDALKSIEVKNTEYTIENKNDKRMRSDIIITIGNKYINIEMNKEYYKGVFSKNDAYLNKLKASLYNSGENYFDAGQVIQINFNNFCHFKHKKDIYKFMYREETTNEVDEDSTIKYHVSLSNVWDRCYNKDVKKFTKFERFCLILRTQNKEYARKVAKGDEVMEKLVEKIEKLSIDDKMIGLYDAEIEEEKIRKTRLLAATHEGLEKGMKQGLEQGKEQNKIEMIKSFFDNGVSVDVIAASVGMSVEEVNEILNK